MDIDELIEKAKAACGVDSDYALAPKLGLTRAAVSRWRRGVSLPSDETILKLAELLELDPAILLADFHARSSENPQVRKEWIRVRDILRECLEKSNVDDAAA